MKHQGFPKVFNDTVHVLQYGDDIEGKLKELIRDIRRS